MICEDSADWFRRTTVDLQARAIPEAHAFIAAVHHDKMNWPLPGGIDRRYQDPLTASAAVLATCFNDHFQFSVLSVQKDAQDSGQEFVAVAAYRLNRPFGINRGTKHAVDQRRGGRSRSFLTNARQTPYRGLVASSYRSDFEVPKTTPIAARSRMSGAVMPVTEDRSIGMCIAVSAGHDGRLRPPSQRVFGFPIPSRTKVLIASDLDGFGSCRSIHSMNFAASESVVDM
jgi:hypothetical protein